MLLAKSFVVPYLYLLLVPLFLCHFFSFLNKNMNTREILSIVALAALGLCLLCGLAKMAMKNPKAKQSCDHACSLLVFVAVVLVGVSQLLEEEKYMTVPPNYYYAHKGGEKRRIDQACRDCHGKKQA